MKISKEKRSELEAEIKKGIRQNAYLEKSVEEKVLRLIQDQKCPQAVMVYNLSRHIKVYRVNLSTEKTILVSFNNRSKRIVPLHIDLS